MKRSNLLLIIGFIGIIVLISAIHISLYAKYKAGDYTIYHEDDDIAADALQTFPNIAFVSIRNVPRVNMSFSDVAKVEKIAEEELQYSRNGDTLVISAKADADPDRISLYSIAVPTNASFSLYNSSVAIMPGKNNARNSPAFYLQKSSVYFLGREKPFQLGAVKLVAADSSSAWFVGKTAVDSLDLQLSQSVIECKDGDFGQLSILTDSSSRLSLQSKHLLKANIKTIAPQ